MIKVLLNLLYPTRCPLCGDIAVPRGSLACHTCHMVAPVIKEPKCMKCGKPIDSIEVEFCSDCNRKHYHFKKGFSLWLYDERMKKSIGDFKYQNKKEYAHYYIEEIIKQYGKDIQDLDIDAMVPVPLHPSRQRDRGYNQAEVIARGLSDRLEIPLLSNLLIRKRKTLPQKQLDDKERLKNLMAAFVYQQEIGRSFPWKHKRILLIDDIYTTGSTIEACTNVLLKHGINEVYFLTLCIGRGYV